MAVLDSGREVVVVVADFVTSSTAAVVGRDLDLGTASLSIDILSYTK